MRNFILGLLLALALGASAQQGGGIQGGQGSGVTSGSFVITWGTGCTTQPTTNVYYTVVGNVVTWNFGVMSGANCTSNSTVMASTGTPVPAAIRPQAISMVRGIDALDNSVNSYGCLQIFTTGAVSAYQDGTTKYCPGLGWTNTGVKSVGPSTPVTLQYPLTNP